MCRCSVRSSRPTNFTRSASPTCTALCTRSAPLCVCVSLVYLSPCLCSHTHTHTTNAGGGRRAGARQQHAERRVRLVAQPAGQPGRSARGQRYLLHRPSLHVFGTRNCELLRIKVRSCSVSLSLLQWLSACLSFTHAHAHRSPPAPLSARKQFQNTRLRAENVLFDLMNNKLRVFIKMASDINWQPAEPQNGPSIFVQGLFCVSVCLFACVPDSPYVSFFVCGAELVNYLSSTMECMIFLPDTLREAVFFVACKQTVQTLEVCFFLF